ncbi:MAG: hypothetical protein ACXQS7_00505 [Candidatus Syntropharchaeia archaeon]
MKIWLKALPFAAFISISTFVGMYAGCLVSTGLEEIVALAVVSLSTFLGFFLGLLGAVKIIDKIWGIA